MALATEHALGLEHNAALEVGASVAGALPDIIGWTGLMITKRWDIHRSAHSGTIAKWLKLLPPYGLHTILDAHTHHDGERWWIFNERLHYEVLGWFAIIVSFGLLR